jgi:PPM family protein phosphatase
MTRFTMGTATMQGMKRAVNQDCVHAQLCSDDLALAVIADGLGAYADSAEASALVCRHIATTLGNQSALFPDRRSLTALIQEANLQLWQLALDDGKVLRTTVSALACGVSHAIVGHVGDCRVYLARGDALHQITRDHAHQDSGPLQQLRRRFRSGDIPSARHRLTRVIGDHPIVPVDVETVPLVAGDRFVLCCDGVWDAVAADPMLTALNTFSDDAAAAEHLIALAREQGATDDVSAAVLSVHRVDVPVSAEAALPTVRRNWLASLLS